MPAIVSELVELGLATSVHLGAVSSRYSCSTKLVEGTSHQTRSPFSVRLPGGNSLELQFTSITAASRRPSVANRFGQPRSRSEYRTAVDRKPCGSNARRSAARARRRRPD